MEPFMTADDDQLNCEVDVVRSTDSADGTAEFARQNSPSTTFEKSASPMVAVDLGAVTHPGHVRATNEDHCLVLSFERSLKTIITNLAECALPSNFDEVGYGMVVADGMSGVAGGQIASSKALCKLVELVLSTPDWIMKLDEPDRFATVMQRMTERFRAIDSALREQGTRDQSLRGMGTTLTVAVSLGADAVIGHIGDSRAYQLQDGELRQLTRDHTLAQAMIDAGRRDMTTAAMRSVLTAALGSSAELKDPQLERLSLKDGDQLLLCSDGLTEMIRDDEIAAVLREARDASEACQTLVDRALRAGGLDNITAVVARYKFTTAA
jgi:serine/threonine protein phosphatase PrpC